MLVTTIHPADDMYRGDRAHPETAPLNADAYRHYMKCGAELSGYVKRQISEPASVLEVPSGHGRVTRHLLSAFPSTDLWTVDVLKSAIEFQEHVLGTKCVLVDRDHPDYSSIPSGYFDGVVVGSLITHFDASFSAQFLGVAASKLALGGFLIVTTHGERSYELLRSAPIYEVGASGRRNLLACYERGDFGFVEYAKDHSFERRTVDAIGASYGISLIPKSWLLTTMSHLRLTLIDHLVGGWDSHQDIFTFKADIA